MLDLRFIRENIALVEANIKIRNVKANAARVVELYSQRNILLTEIDDLRKQRNDNAARMKAKLEQAEREKLIAAGQKLKEDIASREERLSVTEKEMETEAAKIPNMTHPDVPAGLTETENREIKKVGKVPSFSFKAKDHMELGTALDIIDFETALKVTGQKWYYLKNEGALLELALTRFAFDFLLAEGFDLYITPDVAREEILEGIGFNPRGEESNIYRIEEEGTCLIGTSEITLGGAFSKTILEESSLPMKLAGLSHCFRREAGAAGQFSKGLYRVHQFTKVEMFIFCTPENSNDMHDYLLSLEEKLYTRLEIPFRVVDVCAGDLGNPAFRKYDIEAWMPGRGDTGDWGEITSTSNCTDYQSRRLQIRYKKEGKNLFVHMLNGTAIAVSRTLIAILENFQQADGSVRIPAALVPYTGFDRIKARKQG
ncbi:MAG: serine--tRNA ligase [Spirochaetaceae bacterium]|nr:MAG: serine--tRNA ligase [Spirochaetaceae bacterium]